MPHVHYKKQVHQLFNLTQPKNMWDWLAEFSSFPNRGANTTYGVQAEKWITKQVQQIAKIYQREDINITFVKSEYVDEWTNQLIKYPQRSILVRIGNSTEPAVVVGAHMDTVYDKIQTVNYPGADDDGSGSVTLLEVFRTLCKSGMQFKRPIYCIWYAAEEMNEVGSQCVVTHFQNHSVPIEAVLQLDQTGFDFENTGDLFIENGEAVNHNLTARVKNMGEYYLNKTITPSCDGDSDEWSWTSQNYSAVRFLEANYCNYSQMNPWTHSPNDTMDKLSLAHMTDYLKWTLSFIVEEAHPITNQTALLNTNNFFSKIRINNDDADVIKRQTQLPVSSIFNRPAITSSNNSRDNALNNSALVASMFVPGLIAVVCFIIVIYKFYKAVTNIFEQDENKTNPLPLLKK